MKIFLIVLLQQLPGNYNFKNGRRKKIYLKKGIEYFIMMVYFYVHLYFIEEVIFGVKKVWMFCIYINIYLAKQRKD